MARSSVRKSVKHMLHEDGGVTASGAQGDLFAAKIYKRIVPTQDVCINRENPNRKVPNNKALVAGFDPRGTFAGIVPHGFTHGYWTLNTNPHIHPEDGAGNTLEGDYVARTLIEFDLDDAGITNGDYIEDATLVLYFYRSKSIQGGSEFMFDIHRFHPGLTGNTGDIGGRNDDKFKETATWWEYDFSGGATYDSTKVWRELATGATGTFAATDGATHGSNRWEEQGLGISGSTAEHLAVGHGATGWKDFSGGPVGSDQDAFADNIYSLGFTANSTTVKAGTRLEVDIRTAVNDALSYYNNKLRLMIKLRDDDMMDGTTNRAYVSFYSSEAEKYTIGSPSTVSALVDSRYSPSLHVTYLR